MPSEVKISAQIKREVDHVKNTDVEIFDGLTFNMYKTIKRINYYLNDKYLECSDANAVFWNLSTPRIPHFAKNIDLDTKDFRPEGYGDTNYFQSWILKKKLQKWFKDNNFGLLLNDLSEGLSNYGSLVLKKVYEDDKATVEEVDFSNLFVDPAVKSIKDSAFVIQLHVLTENQLREKEGVWDDVSKAIESAEMASSNGEDQMLDQGIPYFKVWERWGDYEEDGKWKKMHHIVAGEGDREVILFEEEFEQEDLPYYDFHLGRFRGRFLRVGVVERLFKLQERVNTLVNQNAATTEIASLLLFRTQDGNTRGNLLHALESGDIIQSSDLQQIGIDNRGLSAFLAELNKIELQADELCLTPEVISGDAMPSGTPFRSVATLSNAAKSTFKYIKDSIGERLSKILLDEILPDVIKDWNKGEIFDLAESEEDIKLFDKAIIQFKRLQLVKDVAVAMAKGRGKPIGPEMMIEFSKAIGTELGKQESKKIQLPKGFFNFKFGIGMNPTGESIDKVQQNGAMNNALLMIQQNPAIQNNPLFKQYLENNGISPFKISAAEIQQMATMQTPGAPKQAVKQDQLLSMVNP